MSGITRRAFLNTLGISLAASAAPWGLLRAIEAASVAFTPAGGVLYGRAFEAVPVIGGAGETVRQLFPDEVVTIAPADEGWYAVEGGRVQRAALQPISVTAGGPDFPAVGAVVQVSAPYALVRAWCAPDAPLRARVGWGGVAVIEDRLSDGADEWLGLRLPGAGSLSWTLVRAWRSADRSPEASHATVMQIDRRTRTAALLRSGRVLWRTRLALPDDLQAGEVVLNGRRPVGQTAVPCAPWELDFGAWRLHGAYWHNHFGEPACRPSSGNIEASVLAAQALYAHAPAAAQVI